jgi:hypothetical protein
LAICTRAARPLAGLQYRLSSKLTHRQRTSLRAKRSKAKQSRLAARFLDCFVASLLAMTIQARVAISEGGYYSRRFDPVTASRTLSLFRERVEGLAETLE